MKTKTLFLLLYSFSFTSLYSQIDANLLYNCYKQGKRGNCASIALIKASLNVYGLENVFQIVNSSDSAKTIRLKNGKDVTITKEELAAAKSSADFVKLRDDCDDVYNYSILCYAIMAKMRQSDENLPDYLSALTKLQKGYYTPNIYKLLGLENNVKLLKRGSDISSKCGVVAWRPNHALFTCNGYCDEHGKKRELRRRYRGRFQLV